MCKSIVATLLVLTVGIAHGMQLHAMQPQSTPQMLTDNKGAKKYSDNEFQAVALKNVLSVDLQNVTLQQGLNTVARKAGLKLVYSSNIIPAHKRVSLQKSEMTLENILWALLAGTGLRFGVSSNNHLVIMKWAKEDKKPVQQVQAETISGTVTDTQTGETLPGVNILVKGTSTGASTDADGQYELTVESLQDTLVVSFVGYQTQEVPINGRTEINVALQAQAITGEEMVIMGYSTKSRKRITGSVSQVSEEDLQNSAISSNPTTLLEGKAAGVNISSTTGEPGSNPNIRIRGTGSISAGVEPLYVIDGVIAGSGSIDDIDAVNPSDIKSISVLKDASATALYGSRAANGVVVINTKKGTEGKTKIDVNTSIGFNKRVNGNLEMMNSQQLYNYHKAMGDPNLNPDLLNYDTNWQDLAFRTGMTSKYGASVSGGDEKTNFYISGNYYKEEGTLIHNDFRRASGRINLTHDVTENFQVTTHLSGNYEQRKSIPAGSRYDPLQLAYYELPWDHPYNEDGSLRSGLESDWHTRYRSNFLYPLQWNYDRSNSTYFSGDLKLQYDFTKWLYITSTNRFTLDNSGGEVFFDPRTQIGSTNNGELQNSDSKNSAVVSSNLIHLDEDFGDHTIGGIIGFEYQKNHYENLVATGIGIAQNLHIMDAAANALTSGGTNANNTFVSILAQANYNYQDTYFLTLSFRRDGSSRFGKDNRYGNFYSTGISWDLSNEPFLEGQKENVDLLKLRANFGTTGNADIGNYESYGLYGFSNQYNNNSASTPIRPDNLSLTWEIAHTFNIGMDLGLYNRIDLSADVYQRTNKNLLQRVLLPGTSGYDSRILNVGSVRNQGIEFTLSTTNIQHSEFGWTTEFNIGFNRNKVLKLYNGEDILNDKQRIIERHDINTWYTRKWAGVDPDNGDPLWEKQTKDSNGDVMGIELTNNYNKATLQIAGTATPDFTGGMRNSFQYKGFLVSAFFNFVYGNKINNFSRKDMDSDGAKIGLNQMVLKDGWSRWEKPGDHATHPKPVYGGNQDAQKPSSRYLEDGSFIRLKNLKISYDLPEALLKKISIRSTRLFISADNLLTITNFSGRDPEAPLGYSEISLKYPLSRKILFGIKLGL